MIWKTCVQPTHGPRNPWNPQILNVTWPGICKCSHQAHSRVAVQWDHQGCQGSQRCSHHFVMSYPTLAYEVRNNPKDWQWKAVHTWSHAPEVQCRFFSFRFVKFDILLQRKQIWMSWNVCFTVRKASRFRVPGFASHKWYWCLWWFVQVFHCGVSYLSFRISSWGHSRCGRVFDAVRVQWSAQHPT